MNAIKKLSKLVAWGITCVVLGTASTAGAEDLAVAKKTLIQQLNAYGVNAPEVARQIAAIEQSLNQDNVNQYIPIALGGKLFSAGGDIEVGVLPNTASFTSTLFWLVPALNSVGIVATNHDVGTVINIGSFDRGLEVIFGLFVHNTGNFFLNGDSSRNADSIAHAIVNFTSAETARVGFEDLYGGGDRNYNDNVFQMSGVSSTPVPEPATILGTLGFGAIAGWAKYKRQYQK